MSDDSEWSPLKVYDAHLWPSKKLRYRDSVVSNARLADFGIYRYGWVEGLIARERDRNRNDRSKP